MPTDCTGKLTADILLDCDQLPVAGLESNVALFLTSEIDRVNSTVSATNRTIIDNLQLKAGKTGHVITGVKQSNGKSYELVKRENAPDKWKHVLSFVIFNPSAANKLQLANLALGQKYTGVVEQKWKGVDNKDAFEVLGFVSGMELLSVKNSSKESDNAIIVELGSVENFEEPLMPMTYLDGDYAASKTVFDNKFVQA